jgi:2'-5' RNA ligase
MRLFTALDLPAGLVAELDRFVVGLKPAAKIAWSKPANLHVTTKFIGEWPEARLDELRRALGAIPARDAITVRIRNVGFFPNPKSPRNFWCGIEAPGIEKLAGETDAALAKLGIAAEKRAYSPHLTLARIKERIDLEPLRRAIGGETARNGLDFGEFEARSFFLYLSRLQAGGSVYTKLAEFPFSST